MFAKKALLAAVCGLFVASGAATADTLELTGVVRDFKRGDQTGGHPDFQTAGAKNFFGLVYQMTTLDLGADSLPVFNPVRPTSKDTMSSKANFDQWFRDTVGVNQSAPLTLVLSNGKSEPGGVYSYSNSSFYPINNQMFGNQGLSKNYHFTFELHTKFTYKAGQTFTFIGDDDVWVYINGKKVIDIGGVHGAATAKVVLFDGKAFVDKAAFPASDTVKDISSSMRTTLANAWSAAGLGTCPIKKTSDSGGHRYIELGLVNDAACTLDFFFAERHTTESNFRIDTSIYLEPAPIATTISPLYD